MRANTDRNRPAEGFLTRAAAAGVAALMLVGGLAQATPPRVPLVIPLGHKDATLATAGTYTLDRNHVAVVAMVSHLDFSMSLFRFDRAEATLRWNPKAIGKSSLTATVETGSIATNVPGFAAQLRGKDYLDADAFPRATFVSTAFRRTSATRGKVDGKLTLVGRTLPVTFDVTLIGAGPGFAGSPVMGHVIGVHAETAIDPHAIGLPAVISRPIRIAIDTEFDKRS